MMSLQVSGWVFLTWRLMVEVCHLLEIIITFSDVLDQTSLIDILLLTFSAAKKHFTLLRSKGNS